MQSRATAERSRCLVNHHARPLQANRAEQVAGCSLTWETLVIFGTASALHTDNGGEFAMFAQRRRS